MIRQFVTHIRIRLRLLWQKTMIKMGMGDKYIYGWERTGRFLRHAMVDYTVVNDLPPFSEDEESRKCVLPHPKYFEDFEKSDPGAAEWILTRAEEISSTGEYIPIMVQRKLT